MAFCRRVDVLGVSESDMPDYALGVGDRYGACGDMQEETVSISCLDVFIISVR
jgi:hypothetical protein